VDFAEYLSYAFVRSCVVRTNRCRLGYVEAVLCTGHTLSFGIQRPLFFGGEWVVFVVFKEVVNVPEKGSL
jgi:hypothetical protein